MISLRKLGLFVVTGALLSAQPAKAYDEDTHFYGTYAMARHAGIRHEAAVKIALSAQWMDESFISDPTSMIFMPVTGVKKRRLLHFPSARKSTANSETERQIFGMNDLGEFATEALQTIAEWAGFKGKLDEINVFTTTESDDPFASQMLFEGMQEGNLMKAATGLHTLEDSFAHEGTPAGAGHAMWWHWPDRPFASKDKYTRMVRTVMGALVGIRTLLPRELLDCDLKSNGSPNCENDANRLAESYLPLIMPVISHDVTRDPAYIKIALKEFFERAKAQNYFSGSQADMEKIVDELHLESARTTSYDAVAQVFKNTLDKEDRGEAHAFNLKKILDDMGRLKSASATKVLEYVDQYGSDGVADWKTEARLRFAKVVAKEMLAWHVPVDLDDSHRMEFEEDKDEVRKFEMELRVKNMQAFIEQQHGVKLRFIENNTKDDAGFYKEIHGDEDAMPNYYQKEGWKDEPGASYATFTLEEKKKFDEMILTYLFPTLKVEQSLSLIESFAKVKRMLAQQSEYYAKRKEVDESDANWMMKKWRLAGLDVSYGRYKGLSINKLKFLKVAMKEIKPLAKPLLSDIVTTHLEPSENVFIYRRSEKFRAFIAEGKAKQFAGEKDPSWKQWQLMPIKNLNNPDGPKYFWENIFK